MVLTDTIWGLKKLPQFVSLDGAQYLGKIDHFLISSEVTLEDPSRQ
jgi:hypothetical protein